MKRIAFALLPVVILLLGGELVARMAGLGNPTLETGPLPAESSGLFRSDPDLFWSLRPDESRYFAQALVRTNRLGLRAPEIAAKGENEFRILSLGESTTFGVGANNDQTYTERLGSLLQDQLPERRVVAINAGVSAYSSFQSLKYLELRGLALEPDLVLFYHEVNDYLPSSLRSEGNTEVGLLQTDPELYASQTQTFRRRLQASSALFGWLTNAYAFRTIERFNKENVRNPMLDVGLPDVTLRPRVREASGVESQPSTAGLNEVALGRRVSEAERHGILKELVRLCRENGVALIVIHPAYQASRRHECVLSEFCQAEEVACYEAFDVLHPPGRAPLYIDAFHPSREGHAGLAQGLAEYILGRDLVRPQKN